MRSCASFTEYYLHNLEKLEGLTSEKRRVFWEQRKWHPIVQMTWNTLTTSNGEGLITYPDGSKRFYSYERHSDKA